MRTLSTLCIVLSTLVHSVWLAGQGQSHERPVVLALVGTWSWENGTSKGPVTQGMKVGPGYSFVREATKQFQSFGLLTLFISGKPVTCSCDDALSLPDNFSGCSGRIPLRFFEDRARINQGDKTNGEGLSLTSSLIAKIQALFSDSDSSEFFTANVRDVGSLEDAVLKKEGNAIDWKPAFLHLTKGEYVAQVSGAGQPASTIKMNFAWNPESTLTTGLRELRPGLHRLHIETTDGEIVGNVWVLIQSSESYEAKAARFAELKKSTSDWGSSVPQSGVEAVLRGGLTELSRE